MEISARVLEQLDRVERLERSEAPVGVLLEALRALVAAAEEWARAEGDERARAAVERLRTQGGGMSRNGQNWP